MLWFETRSSSGTFLRPQEGRRLEAGGSSPPSASTGTFGTALELLVKTRFLFLGLNCSKANAEVASKDQKWRVQLERFLKKKKNKTS